jgi:hypothetical protein
MPKKESVDLWRAIRKQVLPQCFKLGSIFFWPEENHYFMYLGPSRDERTQSFFIIASSQLYWDTPHNFPLVPEDFRNASDETRGRALKKTTYFLFSKYLEHRRDTSQLHEKYLAGTLEYKFNLKNDLPDTFERLVYFIRNQLPVVYSSAFLDPSNILPDKPYRAPKK